MKHVILITLLLVSIAASAQKTLDEYKASNGITYKSGDTIKLGRGSANNGDFLYLQLGGWGAVATEDGSYKNDQRNIGRHYSGLNVVVKKIKSQKWKGADKIWFVVAGGNISNYYLYIEDAIETCEIAACKNSSQAAPASSDKYDQLKKAKELLDQGVITQEEYDKEKAKLLSQ